MTGPEWLFLLGVGLGALLGAVTVLTMAFWNDRR